MSAVKTFALSALILGVSATMAHADPLLSNGGSGSWSFWRLGQSVSLSSQPSTPTPEPAPPPPPTPPPPLPPPPPATPPPTYFASPASSIPPGGSADAYINLGNAPYPESGLLTTGSAQPWYNSPIVASVFGGQAPNPQQQSEFANSVLQKVQHTFQLSGGLAPKITIDPNVPTHHTVSVVSNTSYGANPGAAGITNVGNNGFSFIDKLPFAQSVEQLQWAVAHNVAHELMHAFGVSGHSDPSGKYLDAATASWEMLTDPSATFSPQAIADIQSRNFAPNSSGLYALEVEGDMQLLAHATCQSGTCPCRRRVEGDMQILTPATVPEPATIALWGLAAVAVVVQRRRMSRRAAR